MPEQLNPQFTPAPMTIDEAGTFLSEKGRMRLNLLRLTRREGEIDELLREAEEIRLQVNRKFVEPQRKARLDAERDRDRNAEIAREALDLIETQTRFDWNRIPEDKSAALRARLEGKATIDAVRNTTGA